MEGYFYCEKCKKVLGSFRIHDGAYPIANAVKCNKCKRITGYCNRREFERQIALMPYRSTGDILNETVASVASQPRLE